MDIKTGDLVVIKGCPRQLYLVWAVMTIRHNKVEAIALVRFPQCKDHSDYEYLVPHDTVRKATESERLLYV